MSPAGKFHPSLVPGRIFPWLIAAVHIIARSTSAATLHSKQHTPDEGMDRGLSALVLSIDHIDSILQFQRLAPESSKVTETQFFQLHDFLLPTHFPRPHRQLRKICQLLSRIQQCFQSIIQSLLFQRTFRPLKMLDISADQACPHTAVSADPAGRPGVSDPQSPPHCRLPAARFKENSRFSLRVPSSVTR